VPDETLLIENPIAVLEKSKNKAKAEAFVEYARSDAGQKVFAAKGYRSIDEQLVDPAKYPRPAGLFTIEKFGGWDKVMKEYFDPAGSVMQRIESGLGVSTES
jgi:sulfate transport system substrate-binding protein